MSLTHKIRGEWTSAFSSLLGFCTKSAEREAEVSHFRRLLRRFDCESSVSTFIRFVEFSCIAKANTS